MITIEYLKNQINKIIANLVGIGLADDQNFAIFKELSDGKSEITFHGAKHLSIALKNLEYKEIYQNLIRERAYNIYMLDGGIIQFTYLFNKTTLEKHRLSFLPSPFLEEFQNNPEIYINEILYAEVIAKSIVPFPLRFDFDCRDGVCKEIYHPKSHLTLGQYQNCRIPVTAPLTPSHFIDFIVRNFYHTAFIEYSDHFKKNSKSFPESIFISEKSLIHINVPQKF